MVTTLPPMIKTQKMQKAEWAYEAQFDAFKDIRDILQDWLNDKVNIYYQAFTLGVSSVTIVAWQKQLCQFLVND